MQDSLLTAQDKEFLTQLGEASRLGTDFMLHDMFHKGEPNSVSCAGVVPIWYQGAYMPALEVFKQIEEKVPYSQIYEQWQYRVYEDVERACEHLSKFDARVLRVAACFDQVCESELYNEASKAVDEARRDLYGDESGDAEWGEE